MWAALLGTPLGGQRSENGPYEENNTYHGNRRRSSNDDKTLNPPPRSRRRVLTSEGRCCSCTYDSTCSSHRNTRCECRAAGRECHNCACRKCQNRPSAEAVATPAPGASRPRAAAPPGDTNRLRSDRFSQSQPSYAESPMTNGRDDGSTASESSAHDSESED